MRPTAYAVSFVACALIARPDGSHARAVDSEPTDGSLLVDDPATMVRLEREGYSLAHMLDGGQRRTLYEAVATDMKELGADLPPSSPKRRFKAEWLLRTRRAAEAVEYLQRADNFPDPDDLVKRLLAGALLQTGQREEAKKVLDQLPPDLGVELALIQAAGSSAADAKTNLPCHLLMLIA